MILLSEGIRPRSKTSISEQIQGTFVGTFFTTEESEMLQGVRQAVIVMRFRYLNFNEDEHQRKIFKANF